MKLARVAPTALSLLVFWLLADVSRSRHVNLQLTSAGSADAGRAAGRLLLQTVRLAADTDSPATPPSKDATAKSTADSLPTVGEGQPCGAEVGICSGNLCCSLAGLCGASIDFCGYGCRVNFGKCFIMAGGTPTPAPTTTPARPVPAPKSKGGMTTPMIIIIAGAAVGALLILVIVLLLLRRCRQTVDDSEAAKEAGTILTKDPGHAGEVITDDTKPADKDQTCCVAFFCGIAPEGDPTQIPTDADKAVELQNVATSPSNIVVPPPNIVIPMHASAPMLVFSPTSTTGLLSPGAFGSSSAQLSGGMFSPLAAGPGGLLSPNAAMLSPSAAMLSPTAPLLSPAGSRAVPAVGSEAPKPAASGQRRNLFAEALAQLDGLDSSLKSPTTTEQRDAHTVPIAALIPTAPVVSVSSSQDSLAAAAASTMARAPALLSKTSRGDETDDESTIKYVHVIKEGGLTSIHTNSSVGAGEPLHSGAYCPACSYGSCTVHAPGRVNTTNTGSLLTGSSTVVTLASATRASATASEASVASLSTAPGAAFEMMQRGNANNVGEVPIAPSTPRQPSNRTYTSPEESESDRDTAISSREVPAPLSITIIPSRPKFGDERPRSPGGANYSSGRSPGHPRSPGHSKSPYRASSRSPHHPRSPHHLYSSSKSPRHSYAPQPRSPHHSYGSQSAKSPGRAQPRSPHTSYGQPNPYRQPKSPAATYTSRDLSPGYHLPSRPKSPAGGASSTRSISPAKSSTTMMTATTRSQSPDPSASSRSSSPSGAAPVIRTNPAFRGPSREPRVEPRMEPSPISRDLVRPGSRGDLTRDEYYEMRTTPPRTRAAGKSAERRRGMVLGADDDSDNADDLGFFMPNPAGSGGVGVRR